MELPISLQLCQTAAGLALGAAAGVLYDVLRLLRHALRTRTAEAVCDALFCLACAAGLFLLGLSVGEGRQRGFVAVFAFLGMGLYWFTAGPYVRAALERAAALAARPFRFLLKTGKKFSQFVKNLFHFWEKWVILDKSRNVTICAKEFSSAGKRGHPSEISSGGYFYEDHSCGAAGVRNRVPCVPARTDRHGKIPAGGAAGAD